MAQFTAQTGVQIDAGAAATSPRLSAPVQGTFTADQALARMLAGSGISYRVTSPGTMALEPAGSTTVGVAPIASGGASTLPPLQVQGGLNAARDPYADPQAPYKADRVEFSRITGPILDTPRSVTVITREALEDKRATTLQDVARSTAGITLGTGEGGNAFGDSFFLRGLNIRNNIFVAGVRDVGVSTRETFNAEQIEILRGPASSLAGRGTAGGAINIVTKQATTEGQFIIGEGTVGTDGTKRATVDGNYVVNDKLAVRINAMGQGANIAGRDFATDNRWGVAAAITYKPTDNITAVINYQHTYLWGLPDFGVPTNQPARIPATLTGVPRTTFYGFANRDFSQTTQDLGTFDVEWRATDWLTLENKFRTSYSLINYVGTIPENPSAANAATRPFSSTLNYYSGYSQLNAQSRYQPVWSLIDQPQATFKFDTGPVRHTAILGAEFSRERTTIDSYAGLTSELTTGAAAFTSAGAPIASNIAPPHYFNASPSIYLTGNTLGYALDTAGVYLIETANYNDQFIFNGGVRLDNYNVTAQQNGAFQATNNTLVDFNLGLTYKPVPNGALYVAYATASNPMGAEIDGIASAYGGLAPTQSSAQLFGPQLTRAWEIGAKWEFFERRLLTTAAAFQTDVTNARETAPAGIPGFAQGTIVANASYRIQGLDFEVSGKITDRWSVLAGLVLMKTQVTNSINPYNIGLPLANVANESFNLLTKYRALDWLEVGGQAVYRSQMLGGTLLAGNGGVPYGAYPNPTKLPEYWRFDLFAEAKISDNAKVKLQVQNLFDTVYFDSFYQSIQPFAIQAPGRAAYLVGTVKF
jgi:catecholate siderophore receptor